MCGWCVKTRVLLLDEGSFVILYNLHCSFVSFCNSAIITLGIIHGKGCAERKSKQICLLLVTHRASAFGCYLEESCSKRAFCSFLKMNLRKNLTWQLKYFALTYGEANALCAHSGWNINRHSVAEIIVQLSILKMQFEFTAPTWINVPLCWKHILHC